MIIRRSARGHWAPNEIGLQPSFYHLGSEVSYYGLEQGHRAQKSHPQWMNSMIQWNALPECAPSKCSGLIKSETQWGLFRSLCYHCLHTSPILQRTVVWSKVSLTVIALLRALDPDKNSRIDGMVTSCQYMGTILPYLIWGCGEDDHCRRN